MRYTRKHPGLINNPSVGLSPWRQFLLIALPRSLVQSTLDSLHVSLELPPTYLFYLPHLLIYRTRRPSVSWYLYRTPGTSFPPSDSTITFSILDKNTYRGDLYNNCHGISTSPGRRSLPPLPRNPRDPPQYHP